MHLRRKALQWNIRDSVLRMKDFDYAHIYFYASEIEDRGHIVFVLSVILSFCPPLWNFKLADNFWTISARASIFHMNIPYDKTFPWVPLYLTLWPWRLNFYLANNFWTVSDRASIFHMNIPYDKTFPWVPLYLTLWPWRLTRFLKI